MSILTNPPFSEFSTKDLKSVGNYTLGRLIGKGSFGKVYLATHKLTNGSKVVLKSANKADPNLAREIHHHRQFVHPHIARLYEVVVTETMVWMVLEYCSGDELYDYLLKHGPLPADKVQRIFAQLVGAVAYVHRQSCVHRDLKLENILFDKHENVKLVDFGFTREYEGKANHLQTFCGTICYSAPEMLKGEKYAGEKVDVWSLGVILYALLCGELPFDDDDDNVTRTKILTDDPKFPDNFPPDALSLIKLLLSKRPILRPTLSDILNHPFLAEHAPAQQVILAVQPAAPFSSPLEKETLQRMRSAGVSIDSVIESVLSQRCDALAGWWTLLLEKEERKARRRERKRKEKDAELRSLRRLSAASSRLERMTPTLQNVREEGSSSSGDFRSRGRSERRSAHYYDYRIPDLPQLSEAYSPIYGSDDAPPPPPVDKDSIRSVSTSRTRRPPPPPKEGILRSARSRGSTLHLVTTSDALQQAANREPMPAQQKVRKKSSQAIIAHWKHWTHWILESTRRRNRNRPHHRKGGSQSTPDLRNEAKGVKGSEASSSPRPATGKYPASSGSGNLGAEGGGGAGGGVKPPTSGLPPGLVANGHAKASPPLPIASSMGLSTAHIPPRVSSTANYKRQSLSPSPLTPRTAMRRTSGLRGRKSTSSSVSSIRSIHHHHHSHSKASSTSSNGSVSTAMSKSTLHRGASPRNSVKVLPATPTPSMPSIPSNIRLVRGPGSPAPLRIFNEGMPAAQTQTPGSPNPFAGGGSVMFAKRKRNLFKGPMLNTNRHPSGGGHSRSGSASGLGRRSGEITIEEEDEDDDVEVVEFSPTEERTFEEIR
ncbi:related to serine/threonine-specific protein kinase [Cephalotrichum gorgonifer]|uniref:Related to serine/threonine-specific protein kinase n=1 Tax=Cephalotrichum gorgonifer TaxID=2041049 RepID=A0AAE8MNC0_9PEZI|nr:related to serine/threonine-specific protein kinase [Cephalotrichum gorgonifer]